MLGVCDYTSELGYPSFENCLVALISTADEEKIERPSADPEKAFPPISNKRLSGNILYATNPGASFFHL